MHHCICTLTNFVTYNVVTHAMFVWEYNIIGSLLWYRLTTLLLNLVVLIFFSCTFSRFFCVSSSIIITSFLWSPDMLSICLCCRWIGLMNRIHFISTTVGTRSILSTCLWRNSSLVWIPLSTKSIGTMTRGIWRDWCSIASCVNLRFEKCTLWMILMNTWGSTWPVTCNCWIGVRRTTCRWNNHVMHELLLFSRGRCLPALSCTMLFTVFVEIKWFSEGSCVHIVCCLWINNTLFGTILTHY